MPEFTHADRNMIDAENALWNCREILVNIENAGAFTNKIGTLQEQVEFLAAQIRAYNDQFEVAE